MDRGLALVLLAAVLCSAASIAIHYPPLRIGYKLNDFGIQYSDIVNGIFLDRFSPQLPLNPSKLQTEWFNPSKLLSLLSGEPVCPAPYIDYLFEYPPLVGGLWFATTCLSIELAFGKGVQPLEVSNAIRRAADINFLIQSSILSACFVALSAVLYKLLRRLGRDWRRAVLLSVLPSSVMYLAYNWDAIVALLAVLAISSFASERYLRSGLCVGLAIATKILGYALAIAMLYELVQRAFKEGSLDSLKRFCIGLAAGCGVPFLALAAAAPQGLFAMFSHAASWYCENCIYLPFIRSPTSPALHIVALSVTAVAMLAVLAPSMRGLECVSRVSFLAMCVAILFSYIFAPQMWLELSPLAMLALSSRELKLFVAGDVLNAGIMLAFFKDVDLRALLLPYVPGMSLRFDPWSLSSPVQWIAMARNVVLLFVWASCLASTYSRCRWERYPNT
ncbi:MAG: hypothetical protein GXO32_01190 [Crenarchaeota archaeon]|nr:hypothetical protein [Thermoproteota archaeon]